MQQFNTLEATVNHSRGRTKRTPVVSHIKINLGPVSVAQATLGGKFSEQQAINEFKRLPHRFTKLSGFDSVKLLGVVA